MQIQEEKHELHLKLKLKDDELKRSIEKIRLLSAKLAEGKESQLSADDGNVVCAINVHNV